MRSKVSALCVLPAFLVAGLLVPGCSAHRMYRSVSVEELPDYSLAFIEFDDQGEPWAHSQLDRALAHLEQLNKSHTGVALVLFVHGWNTDASPREEREGKGTVYQYRAILSQLAETIREEFPEVEVPVMGIYLGWRGRVSSLPLLREASFYNRRGAAERIAGAPATEAIYRILTVLRENPNSRSVLIGHSFGSMILERALTQAVVSALLITPGQQLTFPADLVVFLNPAGSATRTKHLVDILARNRVKTYRLDADGHRFERPLLVSFTSESDRATRLYFPGGMGAKAINKRFRDYGQEFCSPISDQRHLYTHTAGHLLALHSHEVTVGAKHSLPETESPPDRIIPGFLRYEEEYDPETQQIGFSFDGEEKRFTIKRKPRALNDTPYWIMQVPRELIPTHSAVLTENTFRLIEAALVFSATYDTGVATIVEREDGVRPVALVPRPDGSTLFLDRSRGVYAVGRDSQRPIFLSCISKTIDPSDSIGFHVAGNLAYAVLMTHHGGGTAERCATELYEFEVDNHGYRQLNRMRFAGSDCYAAATVDLAGKRAFLSLDTDQGPQLRVADLASGTPESREFLDLPGNWAPTVLYFEASRQRLFSAQGESGELWMTDLDTDEIEPLLIDHDMGWPVALAYSRIDQRLYVTDARKQTIWALDCEDRCKEPSVFLESDTLGHPTTLAVGPDGTLWLGDLPGQTLKAIAPDGTVESTIRSLSGTPIQSAAAKEPPR